MGELGESKNMEILLGLLTPREAKLMYYLYIANPKGYFTKGRLGLSGFEYQLPTNDNLDISLKELKRKNFLTETETGNSTRYDFIVQFNDGQLEKLKQIAGVKK